MKQNNQPLILIATLIIWLIVFSFLNLDIEALQTKPKGITLIKFEEPCSTSSVKTYMDYRKITLQSSLQYQYIQEHMTVIDGYLVSEDNYIGVALGSYFGEIGSKWIFLLDTGIELRLVKIEHKDDEHTIDGCEQKYDGSVIEFVIDSDYFELGSNNYVFNGNFNNNELFNGNIESYRKVQ